MSPSKEWNCNPPLHPKSVVGKTKQIFDEMQAKLGMVPNLFRVLCNPPAVLEAYFNFSSALHEETLERKVQKQIGLAVTGSNLSDYRLRAHVVLRRKAGLTENDVAGCHPRAGGLRVEPEGLVTRGLLNLGNGPSSSQNST
jgi:alkylhydroperoxidase family enzyme